MQQLKEKQQKADLARLQQAKEERAQREAEAHMHMHMHTHMHTHTHTHTHTHNKRETETHMHTHKRACARIHTHLLQALAGLNAHRGWCREDLNIYLQCPGLPGATFKISEIWAPG